MNRTDVYEKNLLRIHEWIRSVDQKISILLALQTAVVVLVSTVIVSLYVNKGVSFSKVVILMLSEAYFLSGYGIVKSITGLYANLKVKNITISEDQLSLTFFKHIQSMSLEVYRRKMKKLNHKDYDNELINQIYISAGISSKKHEKLNDAIVLLLVSILLLVLAFLLTTM